MEEDIQFSVDSYNTKHIFYIDRFIASDNITAKNIVYKYAK